jgi:hypothetical protein
MNQIRLRILQGLLAICLLYGIGAHIANGNSFSEAIIVGGTLGGIGFIPLAAVLLIYWGHSPLSTTTNSRRVPREKWLLG